MAEILKPENYPEYEAFASSHKNGSFTQSYRWGGVKKNWKSEIIVSRNSAGEIKGGMLVLIQKLPIFKNTLLYAPRGPVMDYSDKETLLDLIEGVKELGKKYNAYQFKCDPFIEANDKEGIELFKSVGFSFKEGAGLHDCIQTRHNYMLENLSGKTEADLLKHFGSKTKYKVTYGAKKGVVCKVLPVEEIDDFYKVYGETGDRQNFTVRPKSYLENMVRSLGDYARIYVCYYEGEPLCGGIAVTFAGKTCHVYGGSTNAHRELRATYLLQLEMMKWALEDGSDIYDMQGVVIDEKESPELYGVYQFKQSFSGTLKEYAGEFDYNLNKPMSLLVKIAGKIKKAR